MKFQKNKIVLFLLFFSLFININYVLGQDNTSDNNISKVNIYFFYGEGCPHCAHEKPFLENLQQKYPQLNVKYYETWYNPENAKFFSDLAQAFGTNAMGVPTTFIDNKIWVGYSDYMANEIEDKIKFCIQYNCSDPIEKLKNNSQSEITKNKETLSPLHNICAHVFINSNCSQCNTTKDYLDFLAKKYNLDLKEHDVSDQKEYELYLKFKEIYGFVDGGYPAVFIGDKYFLGETSIRNNFESEIIQCKDKGCICPVEKIRGLTPYPPQPKDITPEGGSIINLPIIGNIDTASMSMPLFTLILAGLDSFNPCSFFVLFFLLSMLVYAKDRKRMLLIGITFIFFSALIYFLFMAAWLNLFLLVGQLMIITVIAGIIALIVAVINIKDFFFFEKGFSLVIPEKAKPKLFEKMRNLLKATSLPSMMVGTVVLAIAANSYELLCTAGFPMVFTRILTLHGISTAQYYLYLVLYNFIYVIPLLFIVLMFVITLGAKKLTEWQGQILKLISGMMMLCLGLILLIKPALLNNIFISLGLMATALIITGIMVFIAKKIKKNKEKIKEGESNGVSKQP